MRRKADIDGQYSTRKGIWLTGCLDIVRNIHSPKDCAGRNCVIHNPSDHSMRHMRTHFRFAGPFDIKPSHTERICEHGVGHPDPDDVEYWKSRGVDISVHGCDGCCKS